MSESVDKNIVKERIKDYIAKTDKEFYPDEIAEQLDIDFEIVMIVTEELIKEEFVEVVE